MNSNPVSAQNVAAASTPQVGGAAALGSHSVAEGDVPPSVQALGENFPQSPLDDRSATANNPPVQRDATQTQTAEIPSGGNDAPTAAAQTPLGARAAQTSGTAETSAQLKAPALTTIAFDAANVGLFRPEDVSIGSSIDAVIVTCEGLLAGNEANGGGKISEDKRAPIGELFSVSNEICSDIGKKVNEAIGVCNEMGSLAQKIGERENARRKHPITSRFKRLGSRFFGNAEVPKLSPACQKTLEKAFGNDFNLLNITSNKLNETRETYRQNRGHELEVEMLNDICNLASCDNLSIKISSAEFESSGGSDGRGMTLKQPVNNGIQTVLGLKNIGVNDKEQRLSSMKEAIEGFAKTYGSDLCERALDGLVKTACEDSADCPLDVARELREYFTENCATWETASQ
ncbi:MAG: hypothetical protein LBB15_01625 [Puniceicoccales bacterium]|jgi:hypothetical protein|nr:hypothetical protein [Puniceicoccales bacterium]